MSYKRILASLLLFIFLTSCVPTAIDNTTNPVSSAVGTITPTIEPSPSATSTIFVTATSTPRPRIKAGDDLGFLKGMNYVTFDSTNYGHPLSDLSLEALADTGTKWVSLNISGVQNNRSSTSIDEHFHEDKAVLHAINKIHALDMSVMMKMHVVFANDPSAWGGSLGEGFNASEWDAWFASYTELILYYAKMAEENGVEILCIGTELGKAQMQTEHFKRLITEVRKVFSGPITYGADASAPTTEWWDQVDYIGIDAYYTVTKKSSPSLEELERGWQPIVENLEALSKKWNKPIIFAEVGFNAQEYSACNGGCGRNMETAELGRLDPQTQANAYQALYNVFRDKDWFQGTFWWMWGDNFYSGGMCDPQYTPKGKLAENVLRAEYGAAPATFRNPISLPVFDENKIVEFPIFTDQYGDVDPSGGWGIDVSRVTSPVYKGTQALKFIVGGNGGFSAFLPPLDTSPYQWLEFYIYSEINTENSSFSVFVGDENWNVYYMNTLNHCNYLDNQSGLIGGQWNRILIPLEEIAADKRVLNNLAFGNLSPKSAIFRIDEVRFVGLIDETLPTPTPIIFPDSSYPITETIYEDQLNQNWNNYPPEGDPANIQFDQSDIAVTDNAIKVKLLNFYSLDLRNDMVDWEKSQWFEFDLYVEPDKLPDVYGLKVFMRDAAYQSSPSTVDLLRSEFIEGGKIQPGIWQHVQIPLDVFGSSLSDFVMISIERPGNGSEAPLMVYVDNVMLRGK